MSQWIEVEEIGDEFEGLLWLMTKSSPDVILGKTWLRGHDRKTRVFADHNWSGWDYEPENYYEDVTHFHELIVPRPLGK